MENSFVKWARGRFAKKKIIIINNNRTAPSDVPNNLNLSSDENAVLFLFVVIDIFQTGVLLY